MPIDYRDFGYSQRGVSLTILDLNLRFKSIEDIIKKVDKRMSDELQDTTSEYCHLEYMTENEITYFLDEAYHLIKVLNDINMIGSKIYREGEYGKHLNEADVE